MATKQLKKLDPVQVNLIKNYEKNKKKIILNVIINSELSLKIAFNKLNELFGTKFEEVQEVYNSNFIKNK